MTLTHSTVPDNSLLPFGGSGAVHVPRTAADSNVWFAASDLIDITGVFENGLTLGVQTYTGIRVNSHGTVSFFDDNGLQDAYVAAFFYEHTDMRANTGSDSADSGIWVEENAARDSMLITFNGIGTSFYNWSRSVTYQIEIMDRGPDDAEVIFRYADTQFPGREINGMVRGFIEYDGTRHNMPNGLMPLGAAWDEQRGNTGVDGVWQFRIEDSAVDPEDFDHGQRILHGTAGAETIHGWFGADILRGYDGDDSLTGEGGNDTITGDGGNDTIRGGTGHDLLYGGEGDDLFSGGDNSDTIAGGAGNDQAFGQVGNDFLHGAAGQDTLYGENGHDYISGGAGDDTLSGGRDDDTINGGDGNDTIQGDHGRDLIFGGAGHDSIMGGDYSDTLYGNDGNDTIVSGRGFNRVVAGEGDDVVTSGRDGGVIDGNGGNDLISVTTTGGRNGSFTINGGAGNDTMTGGAAADTIGGQDGDDVIDGGLGDDFLGGGAGNDTISGSTGQIGDRDTIYGGAGADSLFGGAGGDVLYGGADDDILNGGSNGGSNAAGDWLDGGDGDDFLFGGYNSWGDADTLTGGDGADRFYASHEAGAAVWIMDYDADEGDILVLDGRYFEAGTLSTTGNGIDSLSLWSGTGQEVFRFQDEIPDRLVIRLPDEPIDGIAQVEIVEIDVLL
ncbi:MAG: calcium-binding protein [Pseudooceanicola nanhaiensis]|uniref:calcium-binding protein n=1 Tax=Pseudooceanicola nanhaiensis TaxID=375761 RepID=UPI004059FA78